VRSSKSDFHVSHDAVIFWGPGSGKLQQAIKRLKLDEVRNYPPEHGTVLKRVRAFGSAAQCVHQLTPDKENDALDWV